MPIHHSISDRTHSSTTNKRFIFEVFWKAIACIEECAIAFANMQRCVKVA
ncbi:MAG: hypothetical protein KME54_04530 [Tolypothrix brevis GSE-NOS-MK-07-07A]|nr:hypothetical protein [Tolypothrix brevis GSE-NOS-MK-07-07A]